MPSSAGGTGSSVPGWGTKIPRASYKNQNIKQKQKWSTSKKKKTKKKNLLEKEEIGRKEAVSTYLQKPVDPRT